MTLADEDTNTILTGEVNWELGEYAVMMTLVDATGVNRWPNLLPMQLEPPGGQISSQIKQGPLVAPPGD